MLAGALAGADVATGTGAGPFTGAGTALNVVTVLVGSGIGLALGSRLPERTRTVVTDGLGLVTLLVAATNAAVVVDPVLAAAVGAPVLLVLGAVLLGGLAGSLLRLEQRLEGLGDALARRTQRRGTGSGEGDGGDSGDSGDAGDGGGEAAGAARRARFTEGFLTASLVFCVGPLTVLGSLQDGLGAGIDQLVLKAVLDGFASVAFAASLGVGVAFSAVTVGVLQGALTVVGVVLGDVLPQASVLALTATGGVLLVGVAMRLLRVRQVPVADLLPALVVAPLLVTVVTAVR